jgi:hypothetical protein
MTQQDKPFHLIEEALFALAKYKKPKDKSFIKKLLLENTRRLEYTSFKLIREYPDDSYMKILKKYLKRRFGNYACEEHDVDSYNANEYFLKALASYRNEKSRELLAHLIKQKAFIPCRADTVSYKDDLYYAIWENKCSEYKDLVSMVKPYITEREKDQEQFTSSIKDNPSVNMSADDTARFFRWWN